MSDVPTITLNDGREIPQLGFGVFQVPPDRTREVTRTALEVGYRHIDTAEMYGNEEGVGEALRDSGLDRGEVWITSKLNNGFHAYQDALAAFDGTLKALGSDYVDLFLIHWPLPKVGDYVETWRALEEIYRSGRARSVGVSNFQARHLHRLRDETTITPAVNQIEVHPFLTQDPLRQACAELGIVVEAWSPIAQGIVLADPTITEIAGRIGRTPAQVVLRWHIERGDVVFPKSVHRERMEENLALFDFELAEEDLADISALNKDQRTGPNPDEFNRV